MTETSDLQSALDEKTAQFKKLKRRQERNQRAAHAKGLLLGICSMLRPGDVVLDCGANVGDVTQPLAATGAHVHAFEPDPYAFEKLCENTKDLPNVTRYNAAVGVESGTANLMRASNFSQNPKGGSVKSTLISGGRKIDEADGIEVEVISMPDFINDLHAKSGEIAFLKMDIEGAELDLLEAMRDQGLFDKVTLTVAETHEKKFANLRPRFEKLREDIGATYPKTRVNLDWI